MPGPKPLKRAQHQRAMRLGEHTQLEVRGDYEGLQRQAPGVGEAFFSCKCIRTAWDSICFPPYVC